MPLLFYAHLFGYVQVLVLVDGLYLADRNWRFHDHATAWRYRAESISVPEGLPMSVTLSLALSMNRMLKTNNLVRIFQPYSLPKYAPYQDAVQVFSEFLQCW